MAADPLPPTPSDPSGDSQAVDWARLLAAARTTRDRAWAPYSGFHVGAAVLGESGAIYAGCNVENASYGLTVCAERVAVFSAVAAGERRVTAIAVIADLPHPVTPCGACRQVLAEFAAPDAPVLLANTAGATEATTVGALLPLAFHMDPAGQRT